MNSSLLSKWRWKLLLDGDDMWKKVILAKYGVRAVGKATLVVDDFGVGASVWWRDICRVDSGWGWFSQSVNKIVGNGMLTNFWKDVWLGEQSLEIKFPRLFGISLNKDIMVGQAGRWVEGVWRWKFEWRRHLFVWENELLLELLADLRRRNVLSPEESRCVFCDLFVESASHLFLHCCYTADVWYALTRWLRVVLVLPPNLSSSFALFVGCGSNKKRRKGFSIIWLAFVWAMWKVRNDLVFNNITVDTRTVVDLIQRLSWQWFVSNTAKGSCLLYEWTWNPGDSMLR
jgi:hypothetical protein